MIDIQADTCKQEQTHPDERDDKAGDQCVEQFYGDKCNGKADRNITDKHQPKLIPASLVVLPFLLIANHR